jgi:ABC-type transporter Mla maintaining outer membrane lipid asymmetry ATPase subunit MlaF
LSTVAVESPYRGLRPFEDVDAHLFFGRERETEVIAANLLAARLTVLYGPSGVGKSSVLRAGVMHGLRGGGDIVVRFESWSGDPVAGIAEAVRAEVSERIGEELYDAEGSLAERLGAWSRALGTEL